MKVSFAYLALFALGCHAEPEGEAPCRDIACDLAPDRATLLERLQGHETPLATLLRDRISERGTLPGDYESLLAELQPTVGCGPPKSFVVLSNQKLAPKPVLAFCPNDPQSASRLFVALPSLNADDSDIEPRLLHIAAWDDAARRYRHYASHPADDGEMRFGVQPSFCLECHGGPQKLPTWQPLMNELSNPWSQWIASPDFTSQLFDDALPARVADGPRYLALASGPGHESAARLQPIIEAGIDRFVHARLLLRHQAPELAQALSLLRPAFCDETVNYVSEAHRGGQLPMQVAIDRASQQLFVQARPNASGKWLEERFTLPAARAGDPALTLIPVRGRSTQEAELALVSRALLSPGELLRVRALDWSHPVGSQFRCALFHRRSAELSEQTLLAALPPTATTADLVRIAFAALLADYPPERPGELLAIRSPGAHPESLTIEQWGAQVDEHVRDLLALGRPWFAAERERRACEIARLLPTGPIYNDLRCP